MNDALIAALLMLACTGMLAIITLGMCLVEWRLAKVMRHAAQTEYHARRAADALEFMVANAKRKSQSPERPLR